LLDRRLLILDGILLKVGRHPDILGCKDRHC
jgi:hypothetical protein